MICHFDMIDNILQQVRDGELSPLDAYIELKSIVEACEDGLKEIKDLALIEAEKFKGQQYKGFTIDVRSAGGRYTYDHLPEWVSLKEKMKDIEKMSQAAFKNRNQGFFLNEHTGEIYEPASYREGTTTIYFKPI
jgi:hypothetical protein